MEPRYIIEETRSGFIVKGRPHRLETESQPQWLIDVAHSELRWRREPVEVRLRHYGLEAVSSNETVRFGLFDYYPLVDHLAKTLMQWWTPPVTGKRPGSQDFCVSAWLPRWALRQCARSINPRIHAQWQRLLSQVDPVVLAVHKKVYSACWGCRQPAVICDEAIYKEPYIVQDVLAFRAAAAATLVCEIQGPVNETAIEKLRHWRDLYAPAGTKSYRALNVTLMNLPGGIPTSLLADLQLVALPRPIVNRLELITTILAGSRTTDNFRVFAHASASDIKEAVRLVSAAHYRPRICPLSHRSTRDVRHVVNYLLDYPEKYLGTISSLARRSIRWHADESNLQHTRQKVRRLGLDRLVAKPPVPVPTFEGIKFLETVEDIVSEGEQMNHCIGTYAERAVEGRCYLFHAEHEGEHASIEVSPSGHVVQAYGPRNCTNRATQWAERILRTWGQTLGTRPL
jgi:hypothetical protein